MKKIIALLSATVLGLSILFSAVSCQVYDMATNQVLVNYKGEQAIDEDGNYEALEVYDNGATYTNVKDTDLEEEE
jgi:hypothetical protein